MRIDSLNQRIFRLVNAARDLQRAQLVVQESRQLEPKSRAMLREAETDAAVVLLKAEKELREYIAKSYNPKTSLGPVLNARLLKGENAK